MGSLWDGADHDAGLKVAGPTGRFKRALLKRLHQSGGGAAVTDEDVGRVLRRCLWQWGYELTQAEYEKAMAGEAGRREGGGAAKQQNVSHPGEIDLKMAMRGRGGV
jgi:hypothetical protein